MRPAAAALLASAALLVSSACALPQVPSLVKAKASPSPAHCLTLHPDDIPVASYTQLDPVWRTYQVPAAAGQLSLPVSWDGILTDATRRTLDLPALQSRDPDLAAVLQRWLDANPAAAFIAANAAGKVTMDVTGDRSSPSISLACAATPVSGGPYSDGLRGYRYSFHDGPGAMVAYDVDVDGATVEHADFIRLRRDGRGFVRTVLRFSGPVGSRLAGQAVWWRIADSIRAGTATTQANPVGACAYTDPLLPSAEHPAGRDCENPVGATLMAVDCVDGRLLPRDGVIPDAYIPGHGDGGGATLPQGSGSCAGTFPPGNAFSVRPRRDDIKDAWVVVDARPENVGIGVGARETDSGSLFVEIDPKNGGSIGEQPKAGRGHELAAGDVAAPPHRIVVWLHGDQVGLIADGWKVASGSTSMTSAGQLEIYFYGGSVGGVGGAPGGQADVFRICVFGPAS